MTDARDKRARCKDANGKQAVVFHRTCRYGEARNLFRHRAVSRIDWRDTDEALYRRQARVPLGANANARWSVQRKPFIVQRARHALASVSHALITVAKRSTESLNFKFLMLFVKTVFFCFFFLFLRKRKFLRQFER